MGEAVSDALLQWRVWVHRRVESVQLLEGEKGRRRISVDCTPPPDPRLAFVNNERSSDSIALVRGQVMIPLALIEKSPMRQLDVRDEWGRPVPILGQAQNVEVALSSLVSLAFKQLGEDLDANLISALYRITSEPPEEATRLAEGLVTRGECDGAPLFDPKRLDGEFVELLRDLAKGFILTGLIPAESAGVRQVMKYAFNWHIAPENLGPARRARIAAGIENARLDIPVPGLANAASYHLEFQVPNELECVQLSLPPGSAGHGTTDVDNSGNPVAHVHGSYREVPSGNAILIFSVPWSGARLHAALATAFTALVLTLERILPGAQEALLSAGDGAAAVLLAAPVILIALAASASESAVAASVLTPLRVIMFSCAGLLTAAAASIVGQLSSPWIDVLWCAGAVVSTVLALLLLLGPAITRQSK